MRVTAAEFGEALLQQGDLQFNSALGASCNVDSDEQLKPQSLVSITSLAVLLWEVYVVMGMLADPLTQSSLLLV